MRITSLEHSCLLVEHGATTLLVDPGAFSPRVSDLLAERTPDAVLVTHAHPDHLDPDLVPRLLERVGAGRLHVEAGAAEVVREAAGGSAEGLVVIAPGDVLQLGGFEVTCVGGRHAVIHDEVPRIGNVGLLLRAGGETLFHPGDAYDTTPEGVDVLAVPLNAPWAAVEETVEFVRAVSPALVLPIHDGLLRPERREIYLGHVRRLGGAPVHDPLEAGPLER